MNFLMRLLRAHDQRQLLVVPPKPGMDISELHPLKFREEKLYDAVQKDAITSRESYFQARQVDKIH